MERADGQTSHGERSESADFRVFKRDSLPLEPASIHASLTTDASLRITKLGTDEGAGIGEKSDLIKKSENDVGTSAQDGGSGVPETLDSNIANVEVYRIPTHAGWFSWQSIHRIEKQSLPEFFNEKSASKTPRLYKDYRDAIITRYRQRPSQTLTFTDTRRLLVGDVNAIRRVFDFLDQWGLINYQAKGQLQSQEQPSASAAPTTPPTVVVSPPTPPPGLHLSAIPLLPAHSLYHFQPPRATPAPTRGPVSAPPHPVQGEEKGQHKSVPALAFHCNNCGGDCSLARFHCQTQADFDLCPACFSQAKFGPGMTASDFIAMEAPTTTAAAGTIDVGGTGAGATEGTAWSDEESLLLLEGLEMFGEKWSEVAEHVGTRSKAECILHFIRMPIEDRFLDDMQAGEKKYVAAGGGVDSEAPLPFADTGNPVMAQVAFLASLVGPRIGAAAARAALAALTEEDPGVERLTSAHQLSDSRMTQSAPAVQPSEAPPPSAPASAPAPAPSHDSAPLTVPKLQEQQLHGAANFDGSHSLTTDVAPTQPASAQEATGVAGEGGSDKEQLQQAAYAVRVRSAAATALGAAAVKAKLMADQEEREIQALVAEIVEKQIKKVEIKLRHFDTLEEMLGKEMEQVERHRQQVYAERVRLTASFPKFSTPAMKMPSISATNPSAMTSGQSQNARVQTPHITPPSIS